MLCFVPGDTQSFVVMDLEWNQRASRPNHDIPHEIIEAGKLDGTGFWQEIRYITLPLLGPLIGTQAVLNIISMLSASGNILLLTEGRYGTTTLNYWFYDQIVVSGNYNVPAAMGLLMTLFTLPFVIVGRRITGKIEDIEY